METTVRTLSTNAETCGRIAASLHASSVTLPVVFVFVKPGYRCVGVCEKNNVITHFKTLKEDTFLDEFAKFLRDVVTIQRPTVLVYNGDEKIRSLILALNKCNSVTLDRLPDVPRDCNGTPLGGTWTTIGCNP